MDALEGIVAVEKDRVKIRHIATSPLEDYLNLERALLCLCELGMKRERNKARKGGGSGKSK